MKLSTFATINSGVYSSTISEGEIYYLQARDFDENRKIALNLLPALSYTENLEKHFLQKGNILLVAKGSSFLSAVYDGYYSPAVASTVFLVIQLNNESQIDSDYLSWFLNQSATQTLLLSISRGTSIPSINKKMLLDLEIPVPSIKKQQQIMNLVKLTHQEKLLKRKIEELKENQINQIIINAINN